MTSCFSLSPTHSTCEAACRGVKSRGHPPFSFWHASSAVFIRASSSSHTSTFTHLTRTHWDLTPPSWPKNLSFSVFALSHGIYLLFIICHHKADDSRNKHKVNNHHYKLYYITKQQELYLILVRVHCANVMLT